MLFNKAWLALILTHLFVGLGKLTKTSFEVFVKPLLQNKMILSTLKDSK